MLKKENILLGRILIIITLYILQGFLQGFKAAIPLYLASYKATWQEQGIFSCVTYPFSFKILWAPIIDSIYIRRFGRSLTWLVPIQITIGIILIILSFYLESFLINLQIIKLTTIYFFIYVLIASQDIVVDGWSIILFTSSNLQWSSTCHTIGQVIGQFLGSTVVMTLESSNFTNKYIRKPFSLPLKSYGLISLQQFLFYWGLLFIIVSLILVIIFFHKSQSNTNNYSHLQKKLPTSLNLSETYLAILKLFKKQCMREFALILFTFNVGFAATDHMTSLTLLQYGVTRDTLALLYIPSIILHIIVPLYMSQIRSPLMWFSRSYIPRLLGCLILVIYIFFTPQIIEKWYFYPSLIIFLCLNDTIVFIMSVSRIGFCAQISEPRIAGTYMTLLLTISNLGHSVLSTSVFYVANWLPKSHVYTIQVGACFLLGFMWIIVFWRRIARLDKLSTEEWYLKSSADLDTTINYEPTVKYN